MLANYDGANYQALERCTSSYDEDRNCRTRLVRHEHFPEALEAFLKVTGYISPDRVVDLPHDVAG